MNPHPHRPNRDETRSSNCGQIVVVMSAGLSAEQSARSLDGGIYLGAFQRVDVRWDPQHVKGLQQRFSLLISVHRCSCSRYGTTCRSWYLTTYPAKCRTENSLHM